MNDADDKPTQDRDKYLKAFEKQADGKTPPESRTWSDAEKGIRSRKPRKKFSLVSGF
ncbi:MAG: hypothetical protein H0U43_06595 [Chthoniobacterales bacterium]|nr:hypothetical protein [Chthoniobacterales bacterium]